MTKKQLIFQQDVHRYEHFILILVISLWFAISNVGSSVQAAKVQGYTSTQAHQIKQWQHRYDQLSQQAYSDHDIYQQRPRFAPKLTAGQLRASYQRELLDYVNFYRALAGLPGIRYGLNANNQAQWAAVDMAAADGFSHGLIKQRRPKLVTKNQWAIGQQVTETSNIGQMVMPERIDQTMGNYLRDNFNVEGNNTGHRAWLLSPVVHTIGIGIAHRPKSTFGYSNIYFADQSQRAITPTRNQIINYPSAGVFPRAMLVSQQHDHPIYWSSNFTLDAATSGRVRVEIRDDTTHQQHWAHNVRVNRSQHYGQFAMIITYRPPFTVINGHQYTVSITGLTHHPHGYRYRFSPFKLVN